MRSFSDCTGPPNSIEPITGVEVDADNFVEQHLRVVLLPDDVTDRLGDVGPQRIKKHRTPAPPSWVWSMVPDVGLGDDEQTAQN